MPKENAPKQDITAQLESGKLIPLMVRLTVPAVIAQLITFLYNIVDRMYVAHIPGSGMDALAALPQWEGDRIFLDLLREDAPFFSLKLRYEGEHLVYAALDGRPLKGA